MPRPIRAILDVAAMRANLAVVRAAAPRSRTWAVVKADAYGHGTERAMRGFAAADGFALLDLDEAARLRDRGVAKPILLLEGFFEPGDLAEIERLDLWTVVHSPEQLEMIERAPARRPLRVFLKMNSGMNRLGFAPEHFRAAHERLVRSGKAGPITAMTHFADADGPRGIAEQLARFDAIVGPLALECAIANSPAILRYPATHRDWVRPGIMLYGGSPFVETSAADLGLAPTMTLESRVIAVQTLQRGDRVGYGGTYVAERPGRIGIVACGYADGYPRHAASGTPILVDGVRTVTVGRVSMDMLVVDLGALPQAGVGSDVVLWGRGLSVDEVAASAGTVSYELLCALAPRVPRVEIGG